MDIIKDKPNSIPNIMPTNTLRSIVYGLIAILLLLGGYFRSHGQSGASLYHLQAETFQGSYLNPAFLPQEKFILGLPGISAVSVAVNSPLTYNNVYIDEPAVGEDHFNEGGLLGIDGKSFASFDLDMTLLYLAWRPNRHAGLSFSIRQRAAGVTYVDRDLVRLGVDGEPAIQGRTINIERTMLDARYFREYGLSMATTLKQYGLDLGARVKLIHGIANASSDPNLQANFTVTEDGFGSSASLTSVIARTAGFDDVQEVRTHTSPSGGNFGVGVDLGVNWRMNQYFSTSLAINDLGLVRWKKDITNYELQDVNIEIPTLQDIIRDRTFNSVLLDSIENIFEEDTTNTAYTTGLNTNIFGSATFHATKNDLATLSFGSFFVQDRARMIFGLGYTRKLKNWLALSLNAVHTQQSGFDLGAGLALDFAGMQIYAASDKLTQLGDYKNMQAFDARFGVVFIFGRRKEKVKGPKEEKSNYEDGGIYQIIPLRRQPDPYKYPKKRKAG